VYVTSDSRVLEEGDARLFVHIVENPDGMKYLKRTLSTFQIGLEFGPLGSEITSQVKLTGYIGLMLNVDNPALCRERDGIYVLLRMEKNLIFSETLSYVIPCVPSGSHPEK
jgi:hypothetical protein